MEREKELTKKFQEFFDEEIIVYKDNRSDEAFEYDCFIHVVRNGLRFSFYYAYKEKDIPKFVKKVENVLNKLKMWGKMLLALSKTLRILVYVIGSTGIVTGILINEEIIKLADSKLYFMIGFFYFSLGFVVEKIIEVLEKETKKAV